MNFCFLQTGFGQHFSYELGDDAAALLHLRLLGIGQIGYDADDVARTRRLARIAHDEQLHDAVVRISE